MNTFIAAAYLVIQFTGSHTAITVPMPTMAICEQRLAEMKDADPNPVRYGMCIPTDATTPFTPGKKAW